jgi:hypothetical protein
MSYRNLINEIIASYARHGWQLRRVLLRPENLEQVAADIESAALSLDSALLRESEVDALWFSRASHEGREAWELRQVSENPFALFETFEADEAEEDREDLRREMEARLRERTTSEK